MSETRVKLEPSWKERVGAYMDRPDMQALSDEPLGTERTDTSAERRRLAAAIADGMAKLPEAQRAVLVLREFHDLDYAEIADALELDIGTVKSRLSRARAAMREHLIAAGVHHA